LSPKDIYRHPARLSNPAAYLTKELAGAIEKGVCQGHHHGEDKGGRRTCSWFLRVTSMIVNIDMSVPSNQNRSFDIRILKNVFSDVSRL
jgi:hypothetical protein